MKIKALRVSFIFTETILDLQYDAADGMPLSEFVTEPGYRDAINALQSGGATQPDQDPDLLGLELPWPYPVGHHFWGAYLYEKQPGSADGKLCFEKMVPLRCAEPVGAVEASFPQKTGVSAVNIRTEGFYYPYGTGLVINVALIGEFTTVAAGDLALALRHEKIYKLAGSPAGSDQYTLHQIGSLALERCRQAGFGVGTSGTPGQVFSIATVVRGTKIDPGEPLEPDGEYHRLLNGLTGWARGWKDMPAPELKPGKTQLTLKQSTARKGNVLFAASRGRAVWFPGLFRPSSPPLHSLACYHRNLSLASLQAESLLMLASAVQDKFQKGAAVPNSVQRLGRLAAGLLGRLYSGTKTYRSDSLRAQIDMSRQFADVSALRQSFGMKSIP